MANNLPEVLRMLWYWAWFRIRKVESRHFGFIGPLGPELKGEGHLRVYKYLVTLLVGTLFVLPATGQSTVPAGQSEASVALSGAQGQDTSSTTPAQQPTTPPPAPAALPTPSITGPLAGTPPSHLRRRTFRQNRRERLFSAAWAWCRTITSRAITPLKRI